jgi:hypothetical protein
MAQARTHTGVISRAKRKTRLLTETPAQSSPEKRVSWIPGQIPRSEEEKILHDALTKRCVWAFSDVKDYLADSLYWRDFLRGGLVTDMSLLRMHYYREAWETIKKLNGVLLTIEEE